MLLVIFVVAYVAMAWYDTIMMSGKNLGMNTLDAIFKPQLLPNQETAYLRHVYMFHMFHILTVAPLLLYIGYKREKANPLIYPVGGIALLYHSTRLFYPRETHN